MQSQITLLRRSTLERIQEVCSELPIRISPRTLACAAELVEYFGNWRKFKLNTHRTEWVYQPVKQIVTDFMGSFGRYIIRNAIELLVQVGILERRLNPRSSQDKTYQYRIDLSKFDIESRVSKIERSVSDFRQHQQIHTQKQATPIAGSTDAAVEISVEGEEEVSQEETVGFSSTENIEKDSRPQTSGADTFSAPATEAIFEEIEDLGIAINPQIEQVVKHSALQLLQNAIAILKAKRRRGDRLSNPAGFFIRAVRERWIPEPDESRAIAPPGFSQWFDAARAAGIVTHSCRDGDSISVLTSTGRWQPFSELAVLYPLDSMF